LVTNGNKISSHATDKYRPLQEADIFGVPTRIRADVIGEQFEENWNKEKLRKK
jgi:hypothetical protein